MNHQQKTITFGFSYQGFTQKDDKRLFTFLRTEHVNQPAVVFSISVELPLLSKIRVPVQDGPLICLQLLNNAFLEDADSLSRWQNCQLNEADFRPFLVERAKKAAEKASRKTPRRAFSKPSIHSNLTLGPALRET
jgi:hypothetical protein